MLQPVEKILKTLWWVVWALIMSPWSFAFHFPVPLRKLLAMQNHNQNLDENFEMGRGRGYVLCLTNFLPAAILKNKTGFMLTVSYNFSTGCSIFSNGRLFSVGRPHSMWTGSLLLNCKARNKDCRFCKNRCTEACLPFSTQQRLSFTWDKLSCSIWRCHLEDLLCNNIKEILRGKKSCLDFS